MVFAVGRLWRVMHRSTRIALFSLAAALSVRVASPASASSCSSQWSEHRTFFGGQRSTLVLEVCASIGRGDASRARTCVDTFDRLSAEVAHAIALANTTVSDGGAKTEPRNLGEDQWKVGTLPAERTFAGPAILSDSYRLEVERTGGTARNHVRGSVCFFDHNGREAAPAKDFTISHEQSYFSQTFTQVAGLVPVVVLSNPAGANGHRYRIRGTSGGEPASITQAREAVHGQTERPQHLSLRDDS